MFNFLHNELHVYVSSDFVIRNRLVTSCELESHFIFNGINQKLSDQMHVFFFFLQQDEEEEEEVRNTRVSQERQKTLDRLRSFKQVHYCSGNQINTSEEAVKYHLRLCFSIPCSATQARSP